MIMIPALNLYVLPRLVTIPIERATVPVQDEIDRLEKETDRIRDEYQKLSTKK